MSRSYWLLTLELLSCNRRQKWDDVPLHVNPARLLGLDHQIVLELTPAEGFVAQVEDQHIVLRTAQGNLLRRNVLEDKQDLPTFLLLRLALLLGLSLLALLLLVLFPLVFGQLESRHQLARQLQVACREVPCPPLRIRHVGHPI